MVEKLIKEGKEYQEETMYIILENKGGVIQFIFKGNMVCIQEPLYENENFKMENAEQCISNANPFAHLAF